MRWGPHVIAVVEIAVGGRIPRKGWGGDSLNGIARRRVVASRGIESVSRVEAPAHAIAIPVGRRAVAVRIKHARTTAPPPVSFSRPPTGRRHSWPRSERLQCISNPTRDVSEMYSYPASRMSINLKDAVIFRGRNEIRVNKSLSDLSVHPRPSLRGVGFQIDPLCKLL